MIYDIDYELYIINIHHLQNTKHKTQNTNMLIGLCIPKVDSAMSSSFIKTKLSQCNLGPIKQYTELAWKNDPLQKRVLIRVDWNLNLAHSTLWQEQLSKGTPLRIVYAFPQEWKIYLAKN